MLAVKRVEKSPKGCWTCKRRKIGCDRSLPACSNCIRTQRACEGYGIKLSWPDENSDGRRANPIKDSCSSEHFFSSFPAGQIYFLNTADEDLTQTVKKPPPIAITRWQSSDPSRISFHPPTSLPFGYENVTNNQESLVLAYFTDVLSRMVTTIDDARNGFRTILLPMALSETNHATSGLRQAMFAISAYHLWGHDTAVKYKLSAIRHLSKSFQDGEDAILPQFATSMMLCIGDVFDSVDGSWTKHLNAAKAICERIPRHGNHGDDVFFLQTLLEYHDVLKGFSTGRYPDFAVQSTVAGGTLAMPRIGKESTTIIGALGCSRELMNIIALITHLHSLVPLKPELMTLATLIQARLETLTQSPLFVPDTNAGIQDTTRVMSTAELYRLASLIYLHTTVLPLPRSSPQLQSLVSQSLALLETFAVCTSPWPLFVTAIEVNNDVDRVRVLCVLETMRRIRRIGNVDVLQKVVEVVWKQVDLKADDIGNGNEARLDWREFFDMRDRLPSFI
ncbi:uncharacterized protein LY89DRAFT_162264 [Mollisia scopiformis]|uniref:Zn(2)-C6 fungal-type domain-containing protein n=1 Tax=Mollisia scopiformis TaxID=149040 RepID=A0A194XTD0_MOLSC|nr:uncharacterized protein LY89DRAFT_162264 [Mollisia scopiformis]KUJ22952.1 hypothetical protein LY89DRAFT_162264 [Mollisia scopiformis]